MATAAVLQILFQGDASGIDKALTEVETKTAKLAGGLHNIGTASLGAAGVAVGAIAGIGAGLAAVGLDAAGEAIAGVKSLEAQLGITGKEAQALGGIAKDVFKNNWGESLAEVHTVLGETKKLFSDLNGKELQAVTEQALAMSAAFGGDVQGTLAGAQRLAGAFGVSAGEAMDILAKGAQVTGEPLQEVSLLFQEYSGHLAQLGIDGPAALSAIQSGMAAGAFEGDKVLDMFKEMNLKLTEGSTATQGALGKLGLTGLIEDFRAGEVTGVEAFEKIQAALAKFEGNIPADILADALGTPAEDLGQEAVLAIDLVGKSLGGVEGAAMDAGNAVSTSLGSVWETIKRNAIVALGDAFTPLVEKAQAMGPDIMAAILPAIEEIGGKIGAALGSIDLDALVSKLPGIMDTIGGLVESLISTLSGMDWEAIGAKVVSVGESIMGVFKWIAENPAIAKIAAIIGAVVAAFGSLLVIIGPIIPVVTGVVGAISGMVTAAGGLSVVLGTVAAVLTGPLAIAIGIAVGLFLLWRAKGDEIKAALIAAFDAINEKFNEMGAALNAAWEGVKSAFQAGADFIVSKADTIKAVLLTILTGGWYLVYQGWVKYGDDIKAKTAEFVGWIGKKWDELKEATLTAWNEMKASALAKWNEIKTGISAAVEAAKAKVFEVLNAIKSAWDAAWNGLATVAATAWNNMVTTITTVFGIINGLVDTGVAAVRDTFKLAWDTITGLNSSAWMVIGQLFQAGVDFVRGVVSAGMQLLAGDWRGAWATMSSAVSGGVDKVKAILGNLLTYLGQMKDWVLNRAMDIGRSLGDGIKNALQTGWDLVLSKLRALVELLPQTVRDLLGIASPSKVFAQIGEWITIGLASGIQKADQKAVAALADVIGKMVSVSNGLADFGKKIADMIVPSDQQIAAAKEKYLRMTMILTDFIKSISTLGSLLPVASMGQASPGQIRAINVELSQLSQGFPAIQELQGMTADDLLTGGEADWAARLADAVGKIAGVWGGIADSMTKIATAKFPTDSQLQSIKESTLRIATWAMGVLDQPMITSLGAEEFAKAIKGVVDALATVAGLDLADITRVVQEQLDIAKSNIELIGKWGYQIVTDWLKVAGDDKARAAWIVSLKDFADTTAAAANILKAGDVGNLADIAAVTQGQLDVARANIGAAGRFAWELVTAWVKNAGDATTRAAWIADLKDFADTIGAAVSIFKAGADASGKLGELTTIAEGAFDIIKQNLIDIGSNVASMAEWTFGFTDTFKAWADDMKTAVDVFRAGVDASGALGELTSIGGDALEIVKQNVIDIASTISGLAEWSFTWPEDFKTWADNVKTALDIFKGGADASKALADVASIPQHQFEIVKQNIIDIASAMSDTAAWEFSFPDTFKAWSDNVKVALDIFKAGADASKTLEDVSSIAVHQFDIIKQNVIDIATAMSDLSQWEFSFPDTFDVWGKNVTTAVGIFATVAKSIADIGSTQVSDIAGKLAPMKAAIVAMLQMIGEIARDIGVEEAKARAELAEAIGRAGGALGDFGGGIGGIMELVQSKLFGSDASRGGLGHTQRTKTNRADFFATQLTDTVKRAVGAVQDALSGISIQPNDPKVTALGQLGEAFGKLADGLTKLAEAKLPDAGQLAAIMAATGGASLALAGAAGGGGGAGPTVTGMGGGDMYIQYGNNVIVTDADDQQGLIEALKASIR